jgi:hypothetical protein
MLECKLICASCMLCRAYKCIKDVCASLTVFRCLWCNMTLQVQYFAGLRDDAPKEGGSVSKYITGKTADSRARIINLTFDL